jgi:hypothetical protein
MFLRTKQKYVTVYKTTHNFETLLRIELSVCLSCDDTTEDT